MSLFVFALSKAYLNSKVDANTILCAFSVRLKRAAHRASTFTLIRPNPFYLLSHILQHLSDSTNHLYTGDNLPLPNNLQIFGRLEVEGHPNQHPHGHRVNMHTAQTVPRSGSNPGNRSHEATALLCAPLLHFFSKPLDGLKDDTTFSIITHFL